MKKNFNRHPVKMKKVYLRKGKNIISEDVNSFQKKYPNWKQVYNTKKILIELIKQST